MISNPVIFYIASAILIIFAVYSMFLKNIMYSLLSSIMVFFAAAIIFYLLGSEYNAIIQAAIYGLAVPIIIGISVMFTSGINQIKKTSGLNYVVLISGIIFILGFVYLIMISNAMSPTTFNISIPSQISFCDVISAFSEGLYIKYVWGFEIVSLLLVIVIAGFSVLNRKERL